jgi:type II secretory ATPase GspE/PulE/Tfp pilus assembly ATPase PilB-like protein
MVAHDNLIESNVAGDVYQRVLQQFQADWAKRLNVEQMFTLINGVLPLEACLYYQVLPLFLEGNRLHLGMVTPNDTSALEYVRRIVSYLNYSLVPRSISYDALQAALTGYLNCTGNAQAKRGALSYGHHRHSAQHRNLVDQSARPTLILDDPSEFLEDCQPAQFSEATQLPQLTNPAPPAPTDYPLEEIGEITVLQTSTSPLLSSSIATVANTDNSEPSHGSDSFHEQEQFHRQKQHEQAGTSQDVIQDLAPLIRSIAPLDIQAEHLSSPVEVLVSLPASQLLQELLARVLLGGIGRLYFECHPQHGRILWSQDGILQSVLDNVPSPVFSQLIAELKRFAQLSPDSLTQTQYAEVERLYDRSRVLLRFRFMLSQHGEEATLQVLRGAALRFYERQQLTKLKRDALGIAKQLQTKLNEIRDRAYAEPGLAGAKFESLPVLNQLLQSI